MTVSKEGILELKPGFEIKKKRDPFKYDEHITEDMYIQKIKQDKKKQERFEKKFEKDEENFRKSNGESMVLTEESAKAKELENQHVQIIKPKEDISIKTESERARIYNVERILETIPSADQKMIDTVTEIHDYFQSRFDELNQQYGMDNMLSLADHQIDDVVFDEQGNKSYAHQARSLRQAYEKSIKMRMLIPGNFARGNWVPFRLRPPRVSTRESKLSGQQLMKKKEN
jgi:phage terminase Nu1 subunit (DNA packaging protein)